MKIFNLVTLLGILFFTAVSFAADCTEKFSWSPNLENIDGYKIYYDQNAGGPYLSVVDIGNPTPIETKEGSRIAGEVSGLECDKTYYFVCRAYNGAFESDNSELVSVVASNPPPVPPGESDEVTAIFGSVPEADYDGTIQDTYINLNDENNILNQQLNTYTWPENKVANAILMKIDLAQLPKRARVQSASLQLYASEAGGDSEYNISVHKIIQHNPDLLKATGLTYDGTNGWTANTSCYKNIPLAQADISTKVVENSIDALVGYKSWDVTDMVTNWLDDPELNYGLLLNSDAVASSKSHRYFASSEATDVNKRPKLVVKYTIEMLAPKIINMYQN
ncbi:MAG: fibronectin type III domain-containing protein [Candidatus Electrothrix sp. GM3_4]|nr:fibronectin type III domain-containing protein [Candidatus Electrothrix sp. GM3_4]